MLSDKSLVPIIDVFGELRIMAMLNYAALVVVGALGMSILDQDHAHVSIEEWAIYGVILFSAWKLAQEIMQYYKDHGEF